MHSFRFLTRGISIIFLFILLVSNTYSQEIKWTTPISLSGNRVYASNFATRFAVTREGKLYLIWSERDQRDNDLKARLYFVSYYNGTLSQPVAITDSNEADWAPDIAVDTAGNPHVVWDNYFSGDIYYKYWQGTNWSEPVNISQNIGYSFAPRIKIDSKNKVHIVWHDNVDGDYKVYYRVFDGSQGSPIIIVSDTLEYTGYPSMELDSHDNIHLAWMSRMPPGDNRDVFYRACINGEWTNIMRLTTDTLYSIYPAIAIQKNDLPIIVWQQRIGPVPTKDKIFWSRYDGVNWSNPEAISDTSKSETPSVTVDSNNNIHCAWYIFGGGIVYSSYLNNHWTVPIPFPQDRGGAPQIICDKNNNLHTIWVNPEVYDQILYSKGTILDDVEEDPFNTNLTSYNLLQNYPNPFNGQTNIEYGIKNAGWVKLEVYNMLGQRINTLVNKWMFPGRYIARFDANSLSSGVYIYRLSTEQGIKQNSMILLK
jgi:hypothetical protein